MEAPAPRAQTLVARHLDEELLRLLARQGRRVSVPVFLADLVIAGVASTQLPPLIVIAWLLLVTAVLVARWLVVGFLPNVAALSDQTRLRITSVLGVINGAAHGLSLGFFPFLSEAGRVIHTLILLGLCAGSVATTVGYRPLLIGYLVPTLVPLAVMWGVSPGLDGAGWIERITAVLILLFGGMLAAVGRDAFRLFRESFEIRLQQIELNHQLRAALAAAEAANAAKTRFLASASHDLRQPIHALTILAGALALRPLDARSHAIVSDINDALGNLTSELDALLDISKLDAGIVTTTNTRFALRPLLARLRSLFAENASTRGLTLELHCAPEATVETDAILLERILRNLLENAIKNTDRGGITIEAEKLGASWSLAVVDTGRGIPEHEQERIFEEFYQLENPERDRKKGLGLGLAIVKRLVDLMQLRLRLISAPGEGSRFSLTLPAAEGEVRSEAPATQSVPPALADLRVLVVDDETLVRDGMRTLLEELGCRVTLADGTVQALAAAKNELPDILLADFRLRNGDHGIAAVRALRDLHPGLPALLISGDTAPDRLREAHDANLKLLHKPVPVKVLEQEIVNAVLAQPQGAGMPGMM